MVKPGFVDIVYHSQDGQLLFRCEPVEVALALCGTGLHSRR